MANINPSQDYDIVQTLTFISDTGSCNIRLYRGNNPPLTETIYYREGKSGSWTSLEVSGTSTTFPVSGLVMQVAHNWNKIGDNYMTSSFYGTTNLQKIAISQKNPLTGVIGNNFMTFYAYNCSSLIYLDVPKLEGVTSVGDYFLREYAYSCSSLTSQSLPETKDITTTGVNFMSSFIAASSSLLSIEVPNTKALVSVGNNFLFRFVRDCTSLISLKLPEVGFFALNNIDWDVFSGRLGYLKGYVNSSKDKEDWDVLVTSGNTLYTNYIRNTVDVVFTKEKKGLTSKKEQIFSPSKDNPEDFFISFNSQIDSDNSKVTISDDLLITKKVFTSNEFSFYSLITYFGGNKKVSFGFLLPSLGDEISFNSDGSDIFLSATKDGVQEIVSLPSSLLTSYDADTTILNYRLVLEPNHVTFYIGNTLIGKISHHIPNVPVSAFFSASNGGELSIYKVGITPKVLLYY